MYYKREMTPGLITTPIKVTLNMVSLHGCNVLGCSAFRPCVVQIIFQIRHNLYTLWLCTPSVLLDVLIDK